MKSETKNCKTHLMRQKTHKFNFEETTYLVCVNCNYKFPTASAGIAGVNFYPNKNL